MQQRSLDVEGQWVRWSRYALARGVLAPAAGARRTAYDPWKTFRANLGQYRGVEQPYLALLELRRELEELKAATGVRPTAPHGRTLDGPMVDPPTAADECIITYCRKHGLLGLVPVLMNRITLPGQVETGDDPRSRQIRWVHYFRDGGRWKTEVSHQTYTQTTAAEAKRVTAEIVAATPPTAMRLNLRSHAYDAHDLDDLRDFFPGLTGSLDPFMPSQPATAAFWETYGEPVWEFASHCEWFGAAVDALSDWSGTRGSRRAAARDDAFALLRGVAQGVALSFRRDARSGTVTEEIVSPGLLASYAFMVLQDLRAGRRCRHCQTCQRYFVTNERRSRYCSPRCRNTAQSRRHRAKQ